VCDVSHVVLLSDYLIHLHVIEIREPTLGERRD